MGRAVAPARGILSCPLKDQAWPGHLVKRPDGALQLSVGQQCVVANHGAVGLDEDDLGGDGAEGRHEVIGRFHGDDLACARIDAQVAEQFQA